MRELREGLVKRNNLDSLFVFLFSLLYPRTFCHWLHPKSVIIMAVIQGHTVEPESANYNPWATASLSPAFVQSMSWELFFTFLTIEKSQKKHNIWGCDSSMKFIYQSQNKVLLKHSRTHSSISCGWFCATTAELSSSQRNSIECSYHFSLLL